MTNRIFRGVVLLLIALLSTGGSAELSAQPHIRVNGEEFMIDGACNVGAAQPRAEFVSYNIRKQAQAGKPENSSFFRELKFEEDKDFKGWMLATQFEVPLGWLDREFFLHIEGIAPYYVVTQGEALAYCNDGRTPAEFNITKWVKEGRNTIGLLKAEAPTDELEAGVAQDKVAVRAYVYSQPKLRVADYRIVAEQDEAAKHGVLTVSIVMANGHSTAQNFSVGYDIYDPNGKLQYYDSRELVMAGNSTDTVVFRREVYETAKNLWDERSPKLYGGMLVVRQKDLILEYVPYEVGFRNVRVENGQVVVNGRQITIKALDYATNGEAQEQVRKTLTRAKQSGVNTLWVRYPQPAWFYGLCDRLGMYVVDQPSINTTHETSNMNVGGALSNDPKWLDLFMERTRSMYHRTKNHSSIIGWSLGADAGSGYNMQKTYQWLKAADTTRFVIYEGASGGWNTDLKEMPEKKKDF